MKVLKVFGWVFLPFIMIFVSWKKMNVIAKSFGILWAAFALLMVIGSMGDTEDDPQNSKPVAADVEQVSQTESDQESEDKKAADAEAKAKAEQEAQEKAKAEEAEKIKAEEETKKKNQSDVTEFEQSVYSLEDSIDPIMTNYQTAMAGLADGSVDIFTVYEATENARDAANHLQSELRKVNVPDDLPKPAREALEAARLDLATAYYSKKEAFEAALKYLDDQKPSHMSKFKEEMEMSDSFVLSGISKIFEAKGEVGIDLTAE